FVRMPVDVDIGAADAAGDQAGPGGRAGGHQLVDQGVLAAAQAGGLGVRRRAHVVRVQGAGVGRGEHQRRGSRGRRHGERRRRRRGAVGGGWIGGGGSGGGRR